MQPVNQTITLEEYNKYSSEEKLRIVFDAKQEEQYRKPIPIAGLSFPQQNWLQFTAEEEERGWFSTQTKTIRLQTYRYLPQSKNKPKSVVLLFHGLTSHTNEGAYVAKRLTDSDHIVVGFDQRGFGKSEGRRGFMREYSLVLADSIRFVKHIKQEYPGMPLILCGLSLGGLTSYNLANKEPSLFAGCVLMAPAFRSYHGMVATLTLKCLSFVFPTSQLPKKGRGEGRRGSKNPNVSETRKGDPFRYQDDPYSATLKNTLEAMKQSEIHFDKFVSPVLVVQGIKDNSVHPDGAIEFYGKCRSEKKKLLLYRNLWHNVWQQEQIQEIMDEVINFIENL